MAGGLNGDLERIERDGVIYEPSGMLPPKKDRRWVHLALFLLTAYTTTYAGMRMSTNLTIAPDADAWTILISPKYLVHGLPFSVTILAILGIHEMGHYIASRRWGVRATLPYFVPAPSLIGTFGAVIKIKSRIPNRRALNDIGAAGPLAGFMVAVVALGVGLHLSKVVPNTQIGEGSLMLGDSILSAWMGTFIIGELPEGHDVFLHPVAFAGWLGLFVTVLNLLPVGQLDGGHIVYAAFGRRVHAQMSKWTIWTIGLFWALGPPYEWLRERLDIENMLSIWITSRFPGWLLFLLLLIIIFGRRHPPPDDSHLELDPTRKAVGYLSLAIFVLCFIPIPFRFSSP